jgi:membrane-associated HD superfamily phosphohydrolase
VLENERIVEAHAVVTAEQERKLTALSDATKTGVAGWIWAGRCLLVFVVLMSMGVFLRYYRRDWFDSLSAWLVLASLFLGSTLLYRLTQFLFAGRMEITDYAFPAAFGAIFVTLLFNIHIGVAFATLISILTPILAGYDITLSIMSIIGGLAGAFAVRNTRRRSEIYFTVLLIILANSLTIMSLGLMRAQSFSLVLQELMWGCINAVASVILASVLLPCTSWSFPTSSIP